MNGESTAIQWELQRKRSLAVGFIALLLCAGGALIQPQPFFRAYLSAYIFWIGIPVGCLALLMLHHLVGGRWGFMIQRVLEASIRTLPLMALLFIPLLFGLPDLYPWARAEIVAADPLLQHKAAYLNIPFFIARAVIYFAIWAVVGHLLSKWSVEQDRTADPTLIQKMQRLSGPGLLLYGLTVTFSAIDWIMSLEPKWYSTIFGMIFIVSDGLTALAFVIVVSHLIQNEAPLARVVSADRFHDLGNLLLALVMLWAYMHFSQFLLIWSGNLVEEIPWYLNRIGGGWEWVAIAFIVFLFALPFALLLSRTTKRSIAMLARVAAVILVMHWLVVLWMVAPSFHPAHFHIHWMDIVAPIGIGAVWLGAFLGHLKARSLLPLHDPRFADLLEQAQEA
jgi:hypothetical protein